MVELGFNYYGLGCIQPCRVEDGYVIRRLPSGAEERYRTTLTVNIPEQLNLFTSPTILFYLKHNGLIYVGRKDRTISVYQISDGLLVDMQTWEVLSFPYVAVCGYRIYGRTHTFIYQDKFDGQSVYVTYVDRYSGCLPEKVDPCWDLKKAEIGWIYIDKVCSDFIFHMRGGVQYTVDNWQVQNLLRSPDTRVFI